METSAVIIVIGVGLLFLLVFYVIGIYNKLVNAKNKVDNQFSQIDIQLTRRSDLIPNLVEVVKGYAKHEKSTLKKVIEARNKVVNAKGINAKIEAENEFGGVLNKLFVLTESYPEIMADENFKSLQNDLRDTEDRIAYARQFYNDSAMYFNTLLEVFPSNVVAKMFKLVKYDFFSSSEEEKEMPNVKF